MLDNLKKLISDLIKNGKRITEQLKILKPFLPLIKDKTKMFPETSSFKEKVFFTINELEKIPKCEWCNKNNKKFDTISFKYKSYCSASCATKLQFANMSDEEKRIHKEKSIKWQNDEGMMKQRELKRLKTNDSKSVQEKEQINSKRNSSLRKTYQDEEKRKTISKNISNRWKHYSDDEKIEINKKRSASVTSYHNNLGELEKELRKENISKGVKKFFKELPLEKKIEIYKKINEKWNSKSLSERTKIQQKRLDTMLEKGLISDPKQKSLKEKYYREVTKHTEFIYKKFVNIINPYNLPRTRVDIDKNAYHLDHKVSKLYGFINNIPPQIIGSINNLELLPYNENISKREKNSITIEELYSLFFIK